MNGQGKKDQLNRGIVVSIRGSVVDAVFPLNLPAIYNLLSTGEGGEIKIEVNTHLEARRVRGIALTPTRGLALGTVIEDSGAPIRVPVGERLLGRVFNVFGETIDRKEAIAGGEWRSIHQEPVPLTRQSTVSEVFETGNICPRDEGVRVQSTPRKLFQSLMDWAQSRPEVSCFIGSVQYLDQQALLQEIADEVGGIGLDIFEYPVNRAKLLLMKRQAFAHEGEVRLIVVRRTSNSTDSGPLLRIKIDPNAVFDQITFDPRLEIFERKERETMIKNLGYAGPFCESQLYQGVILQVFLDGPPKMGQGEGRKI
jgi:hypothetical protein